MTDQQIIDEARRIIDGDDVPLWAVAAALQLGYTGDGAVLHVASVVLKWHDLHGNDQELALAEAGAKAMLEAICTYVPAWQEATFRQGDEFDVAAVARRAVEEQDNLESP